MVSSFGELERAVMEVLWDRGTPAAVRDVADALAARGPAARRRCTTQRTRRRSPCRGIDAGADPAELPGAVTSYDPS
jgi:hypothetical protein